MSTFQETRFVLPHITLAAREYGPADGIPVLALHGWLDNAMTFERVAPHLSGVRLVMLDMAGHGLSEHRSAGSSYPIWDYARDALLVADQLGWERFALLGHSLGAITAALLAASVPERITRLALIDGLFPLIEEPEHAPARLGGALRAELALARKRKPVYADIEQAVRARVLGGFPVSREAAELLASRGLIACEGGFTWCTDARLTLPSAYRVTRAQAHAFIRAIRCPVCFVAAENGLLIEPEEWALLRELSFDIKQLAGGHHLHLDSAESAQQVAACFADFLLE